MQPNIIPCSKTLQIRHAVPESGDAGSTVPGGNAIRLAVPRAPGEGRLRISAPSVIGVRNQRSVFGRQRGQPNESIGMALDELPIFLETKVVSEQDGRRIHIGRIVDPFIVDRIIRAIANEDKVRPRSVS